MDQRPVSLVLSLLLVLAGAGCSPQSSSETPALDPTIRKLLDHYRSQVRQAEQSSDRPEHRAALIKLEAGLEWANSLARDIEPETLLEEKAGTYLRLADLEAELGNDDRSRHYLGKASELCDGWELGSVCQDERLEREPTPGT